MEQPSSSLLWFFPEMSRFLESVGATRIHTWMRKFGHPLPKPSVLYSNILPDWLGPLFGKWSPKMEKIWQNILRSKLLAVPAIRKLWQNKNKKLSLVGNFVFLFCGLEVGGSPKELGKGMPCVILRYIRTALKYRAAFKFRARNDVFYKKHWSKSKARLRVSGGKKLKDSGIYTTKFCQAVADVWMAASASGMQCLARPPLFSDYKTLWQESFRGSTVEEDPRIL